TQCGEPLVRDPPRTSGRLDDRCDRLLAVGNTPTDVGKTSSCKPATVLIEKHPHGRGEDHIQQRLGDRVRETPPRTWGRLRAQLAHQPLLGNTPTDVGKT